jgi:hypothetical protein
MFCVVDERICVVDRFDNLSVLLTQPAGSRLSPSAVLKLEIAANFRCRVLQGTGGPSCAGPIHF